MSKTDLPPLEKLNPVEEWAPWKPTKENPWSAKWAAHLYRRAGFGPTAAELKFSVEKGLDATLQRMLEVPQDPPKLLSGTNPTPIIQARADWLARMLGGAEPLRERMTLFWHNHFANSIAKVVDAKLMEDQNALLRKYALGKFGPLLRKISRDASMLIYLDSNDNVKSHPNENYAREVMELFSLGVGNYKEKDIQEAARAFTGWHVTKEGTRQFHFVEAEHDFGPKTVLGQTGNWDGDDILRILLEQPVCAKFLVRKLYRFFVNENLNPPDSLLEPLVNDLRKFDYDIAVPVKTIITSKHFFSAHAYHQKVKSPIDYILGVSRMFGSGPTGKIVISPFSLIGTLELQGQQLYAPPNVKGWEGGKAWLNTATVLARHNYAFSIVNGMKELNEEATKLTGHPFVAAIDPLAFYRREGIHEARKVVDFYANLLLPGDLRDEVRDRLTSYIEKDSKSNFVFEQRCKDVVYGLMMMPEYQLA
jgi:uncharacterized protein (DUF1800 family)